MSWNLYQQADRIGLNNRQIFFAIFTPSGKVRLCLPCPPERLFRSGIAFNRETFSNLLGNRFMWLSETD